MGCRHDAHQLSGVLVVSGGHGRNHTALQRDSGELYGGAVGMVSFPEPGFWFLHVRKCLYQAEKTPSRKIVHERHEF